MERFTTAAVIALLLSSWSHAGNLAIHSGTSELVGPDSRTQLVVMTTGDHDVSREVSYAIAPANVASVDSTGFVTPLADGKATVTATLAGEKPETVQIPLTVSGFKEEQPVSFPNDVVPVFTRNHCNAGACHAKAAGQNGFTLSLLGYEPAADYEQIVRHGRGRRVNPSAGEHSLLLMKASGDIPHEGGARLEKDGADYQKILQWIESGLHFRPENDPTVERIEVFPKSVVVPPGSEQQVAVTAFFSDGSTRDITRIAQYESNQPGMAEASEAGLVSIQQKTGSTAVLVRFQEHIDTFAATIPLGADTPAMPAPTNFIDEQIFKKLSLMGLPPSKPVADGPFLRRVTLDIAGRLPTLEETKTFLASKVPDKRARKIDELLESTDYADFFAGKWSAILRNKVDRGRPWVTRDSHAFYAWIRSSLLENKPYDQFASELVLASGKAIENPAVNWYRVVEDNKEQMENIAQVFLGIRMQCAQCHHHPYEKWSQNDYFSLAAFFSTIERKEIGKLPEEDIIFHNRKVAAFTHPGTKEELPPRLPGSEKAIELPVTTDPRSKLAEWMRSEENPYFGRMLVNRYWKHFFSRGLVEPEDDIRPTNPATHPELLEGLADQFVESGYDLKELVRTICNSRTYQLGADPNGPNAEDEQNFARFYPTRLEAEVLLDSVNDITGATNSFSDQPLGVRAIALPNEKPTQTSEFLMMFGRPAMDTACECERAGEANLGQSLHLLNSDDIQAKLTSNSGRAAELAKATDRPDEERVTELYLRALSRNPDQKEMQLALAHLKKKRDRSTADPEKFPAVQAEREAFEDLVWVLINTKEFMFNR